MENIRNAQLTPALQRHQLDLVQSMNRDLLSGAGANPEVEGVIESYELAFKMQSQMPQVMDVSKETAATKKLYGLGEGRAGGGGFGGGGGGLFGPEDFGHKCLLARRMIEAGVRFVEVTHGDWDTHFNHKQRMPALCQYLESNPHHFNSEVFGVSSMRVGWARARMRALAERLFPRCSST